MDKVTEEQAGRIEAIVRTLNRKAKVLYCLVQKCTHVVSSMTPCPESVDSLLLISFQIIRTSFSKVPLDQILDTNLFSFDEVEEEALGVSCQERPGSSPNSL